MYDGKRPGRRWTRGAVAVLVATTGGASCRQLVDDFHVAPSAATDAFCGDTLPGRPTTDAAAGSSEFIVAIRSLDWGDAIDGGFPSHEGVGLNLDGRCTTSPETGSCVPSKNATATQYVDGAGGIDNATGQLGLALAGADSITVGVQADERSGRSANILRIRGYDGAADDDRVEASFFLGTRQTSAEGAPVAPAWDGSDVWNVSRAELIDGASLDRPEWVDANAYVRGGVLVAHFATAPQGGPFAFDTMHDVILTATIAVHAGAISLEHGVRGGRWSIEDVLAYIARSITGTWCTMPADGASRTAYEVAKRTACASVDTRASGDDPDKPCDALSFGVRFEGVPARVGTVLADPFATACLHDGCLPGDAGTPGVP